ncbi:dTDP-4-dehydrorhamnose 3,5-epimerase family protein [Dongia deserti]|uniref:dTDP-4-dehydrorhamnose 3,5-epimerase family protein n=1 Tax=Dongia deserti TaxID=2268030 RepID=UPI0013C4A53E|nr:dTDP-4-dehydrorhamnose 3,5-epimerase family protein [Dongia deserti]
MQMPAGVVLRPLSGEHRQVFRTTELYREDWQLDVTPVQWNLVCSRANTLRGVHVHPTHFDYLCVLQGEMLLALRDMRPDSPTYRLAVHQLLSGETPCSATIPPGVAHGFYFACETRYVYAVSHYWNPADELGCRWDDPELGFSWPAHDPSLSARDAGAPSYAEMALALAATLRHDGLHS